MQSQVKLDRTLEANQTLLSESWHKSPSLRPFVETFTALMEQGKLSTFD